MRLFGAKLGVVQYVVCVKCRLLELFVTDCTPSGRNQGRRAAREATSTCIDPMADQQKSTTRGNRGRETVAAVSEAAELNALDNFLISFVNLPFALVVPALLAAIAGIGWAMVKYA